MGETLADLQKVERLAVMQVGHGGGRSGAGLLMGTAILGECWEPQALDLNHWSLWVAASPSPSRCAVSYVGLVALIFSSWAVDQLE